MGPPIGNPDHSLLGRNLLLTEVGIARRYLASDGLIFDPEIVGPGSFVF